MHLTHTGSLAGQTLCGSDRNGDEVHAVYAPLNNDEFRGKVCKDCLREYALSFDSDELKDAPEWVRSFHKDA